MLEPTNLFWYSSVAIQFLLCVHLLWTGLARNHPKFTLYLGCAVVRSVVAVSLTAGFNGALPISYTYFWLSSEPVVWMLQIAVTLEVHSGMWRESAMAAKPARSKLFVLLLTSIIFAAIPLKVELSRFGTVHLQVIMQSEFLAKRYISSVLALFLVSSALMFLVARKNSLRNELLKHESMLALYFAIYAVCYFVVNMGWARKTMANSYMSSALTVCLVIWISVLRPTPALVREQRL